MTERMYTPLLKQIAEQIQQRGLMALLRSDQAIDQLLEVGDALLASPILVVAIPMHHPEATALLHAYRARFGEHLLIGAAAVATIANGAAALAAGAEFLLATRYNTELHQLATGCGALYIPPAPLPAALPALQAMAVLMATVNADALLDDRAWLADDAVALLAMQGVTLEKLARYVRAGATAAVVDRALMPTNVWSMPTMIRAARALRHSWLQAITAVHTPPKASTTATTSKNGAEK